MPLYLKLAIGNVRRSARDYSVYFITLGFAACLLYSFVGSTDHVRAMGLTSEQMGVLGSAGDILQAFSVFTVLVFLFLVRYANRFLLRRRKREFALYELYGMGRGAVSFVLVGETALVGAGALALGIALGVALSPAFGAVAAFVFDIPWRLVFTLSGGAASWTAGCFAVVFALLFNLVRRRSALASDTVIGVFSSTAVALGIFIAIVTFLLKKSEEKAAKKEATK